MINSNQFKETKNTIDFNQNNCELNSNANSLCTKIPSKNDNILTSLLPVVFDECGFNLCKIVDLPNCILYDYPTLKTIELEVININFNFLEKDGSIVDYSPRKQNYIRIKLTNIIVDLTLKLLDYNHKIINTIVLTTNFLNPIKETAACIDKFSPSFITVELYAPYGVSYFDNDDNNYIPMINYIGFLENNNSIKQGLNAQALAKVLETDFENNTIAIGLTLNLKIIYFIQYKLKHEGLYIPSKCNSLEQENITKCTNFVEGDLLSQTIKPLNIDY